MKEDCSVDRTWLGFPDVASHGGGVPAATDVFGAAVVAPGDDATGAAVVGAEVEEVVGGLTTGPEVGPEVGLLVTPGVEGLLVAAGTAEPQTARGPGEEGQAPGQQMESVP